MSTSLLERAEELAVLESVLAGALEGHGSIVLVHGEAGVGKSSLIRSFTASLGRDVRVLVGGCDDLLTPRTLGAVRDAFAGCSSWLDDVLTAGTRDDLLGGVLDELADPLVTTVLVIEDLHWADDATLDVLRYLGRRLDDAAVMLIISYRDTEIGVEHPAQRLLGSLTGVAGRHLELAPLSRSAVAALCGATNLTSAPLYELTGGNPFYVAEVVASGRLTVPATVVDAVLGRVEQLGTAARAALAQLAVVPSHVTLPMARALLGDLAVLVEAERCGVLEVHPTAVAFRHEIARRAVEGSLAAIERIQRNAAVLAILRARDEPDLSRLVHHAVQAGDDATVVEFAPRAAARAAQVGGYTQEIRYYRLLLERSRLMDDSAAAGVHQQLAAALWMVDEPSESLEHGLAAVRIWERRGDDAALGEALMSIPATYYLLARTEEALATSARAVELLEAVPETPVRTFALLTRAVMLLIVGHPDGQSAAEAAAASARRTGVPALVARSTMCLGRARLQRGEADDGLALMYAALEAARVANAHTHVLMTYGTLVIDLYGLGRFAECRRNTDDAFAYAHECEMWYVVKLVAAYRHRLQGLRGEWDAAILGLRGMIGSSGEPEPSTQRYALPELARLLARRGDPDAPAMLERAHDFARRADCYYDWRWTSVAEIEAAWLAGRPHDAAPAVARMERLTDRAGRETERGELNRWKRRLGLPHELPAGCPEPHAAGIRGHWRDAANGWLALDAPYEQALELLDSGDVEATLDALRRLDDLGATPAAALARSRLRELGAATIPRGPSSTTRSNPCGLTDRQMNVVRGLARGLTNAEIAAELVLSVRTVDHHVSAVLAKLGAPTRRRAVAIAREQGIDVRPIDARPNERP